MVYARGSKELVIVDDLTFQEYLQVRQALPTTQTFAMLIVLRSTDWLQMTAAEWPDDIIVMQHFKPRHLLLLAEHTIGSYSRIHLYSKQAAAGIDAFLGLPLKKAFLTCGFKSMKSSGHEGPYMLGTASASEWGCAIRSIANRVYVNLGVSVNEYY